MSCFTSGPSDLTRWSNGARGAATREALGLYDSARQLFPDIWESVHADRGVTVPTYTSPDGEIFIAQFFFFRDTFERAVVICLRDGLVMPFSLN
jgi:hypothetical protein